jgi:predicted nucleotidyltransferase
MTRSSPPSLTACDRDAIFHVVQGLRSRWPVERVILFGSKARGDDEPDSDVDLLVITSTQIDRATEDAMHDAAWDTGLRHGRCVQLVVRSHERWYHGVDQATPLRLQINADGVEVFPDDR